MNIICIVKNEFIKLLRSKKYIYLLGLIVFLCAMSVYAYSEMRTIAINNLPKAATYSQELKEILFNLSGVNFSRIFLSDFIYKDFFSFFILFIVIFATDVFANDKESGNMKFTLLSGVGVNQLYIGKTIFMICISVCTVIFHTLLALLVGQIFFGGSIIIADLFEIIVITLLAVLPATSLSLVLAIISQFGCHSKIVVGIGMAMAIIFGVVDTFSVEVSRFSPIGVLSSFSGSVPFINDNVFPNTIGNIIYIVIGIIVLLLIANKQDYYE
ncbi:MAG: ABC transporter permease subunit [Acutalibacteraceae bacterium]|nr:ABC transporter permease subunit [Acutalibacteraceae bacterium]